MVVVDGGGGGSKRSECKAVAFSISNLHVNILMLGEGGVHCMGGHWGEGSTAWGGGEGSS